MENRVGNSTLLGKKIGKQKRAVASPFYNLLKTNQD